MAHLQEEEQQQHRHLHGKDERETVFLQSVIELRRLLFCMEENQSPSSESSTSLLGRAEVARALWHEVQLYLGRQQKERAYVELQEQVGRVCARAREVGVTKQEEEMKSDSDRDWVDSIFMQPRQRQQEWHKDDDDDDDNDDQQNRALLHDQIPPSTSPAQPQSTATVYPPQSKSNPTGTLASPTTLINVEELQKAQRQQLEEEISLMAEQLKNSTKNMHSTLKHQTKDLEEMEELASQNVDKVSQVAQQTQQHVYKQWRSTFATWTMIFTILCTFCAVFLTIYMVPKRPNACLFFNCPKQEKEECVRLHDGTTMCGVTIDDSTKSTLDRMETEDTCSSGVKQNRESHLVDDDPEIVTKTVIDTADSSHPNADSLNINNVPVASEDQQGDAYSIVESSNKFLEDGVRIGIGHDDDDAEIDTKKNNVHYTLDKITSTEQTVDLVLEEESLLDDFPGECHSVLNKECFMSNYEALTFDGDAKLDDHFDGNGNEIKDNTLGSESEAQEESFKNAQEQASRNDKDSASNDPVDHQRQLEHTQDEDKENRAETFITEHEQFGISVTNSMLETLRHFLEVAPDHATYEDANGWQPIHEATRLGHTEVIRLLLEEGNVNVNTPIRNSHMTPLSLAYNIGLDEKHATVKLLKANGANVIGSDEIFFAEGVTEVEPTGQDAGVPVEEHSPDAVLVVATHKIVPFTSDQIRTAAVADTVLLSQIVLSTPALINEADENGWCVIHEAARAGNLDAVRILVEAGCDSRIRTGPGHDKLSPLDIAFMALGNEHSVTIYLQNLMLVR